MNEPFVCVPLTSDIRHIKQIQDFVIDREKDISSLPDKIIGLEAYLKRCAWEDDLSNQVRIYLIKDAESDEIATYFGLKAGRVADSEEGMPSEEEKQEIMDEYGAKLLPEVAPGIEISHFAVNDDYRRHASKDDKPIQGLGAYFYPRFIYPIIEGVASKIGVSMIYLYAAGDEHLEHYYERVFQFQALDDEDYYIPLEPGYDGGCKFMYRLL